MSIYLLQGLALGLAAAAQPGPLTAYLVNQTLAIGFRKTWISAFAPLISDGPIILVALLVLTQMPAWLQRGLNLASGAFILFLAWNAFKQWRSYVSPDQVTLTNSRRSLFKAALMNTLNPMPYIYWGLVAGPILLTGWRENPFNGFCFLGGFYIIMIVGLLAILALFSTARNLGSRVSRALLGLSVLALGGFGLLQLWHGLNG